MIHAKAVGYFDIDEFLHPHKNATEIWNFLSPTCHACLYFLNHWHYMASESPFIFTPIGEPNQKTKRSKYITIPEYTLDYGIHFPCMDNGTSSNVAGRIIHIINLSTYSKRERLSFKAASQYCDAALNDNHKGRPFYSI
jgi:hypothetical protein